MGVCVCMHVVLLLCSDDMPMINLWPHLYAAARDIDGEGAGGRGGEGTDHVVRA